MGDEFKAMPEQAIGAIHAQMGEIAKEIGAIGRDSENTFHKYNFRSIDQVYNTIGPLMAKHGVYCTITVQNVDATRDGKNRHVLVWVDYWFTSTIDGSRVYCSMVGEGMDTGDKAVNKAYAAAHKYCLLQAFCIPTEEQRDGDFESPESVPDKPKAPKKPRKAPPVSVQDTDDKASGLIEEMTCLTTKGGAPYVRVMINGLWMAAFEDAWVNELMQAERQGVEVGVTYVKKGKYTNVTSAMLLVDDPPIDPLDDPNEPPPIDDNDLGDIPF